MKGYGQFCPVAKAAEILNERWTLLVVRELLCGSKRFNDLRRGVPLMSSSLLSHRLKALEIVGVVERRNGTNGRGSDYRLTQAGEELLPIVMSFGEWGQRWVRSRIEENDLDAGLLMLDMHRTLSGDEFPPRLVTLQFEYLERPAADRFWWLVVQNGEVELCFMDPGHPVSLYLYTGLLTMTQLWMGDLSLREARSRDLLDLQGDRDLIDTMPRWFSRSLFATVDRPVVASAATPCNAARVAAASG